MTPIEAQRRSLQGHLRERRRVLIFLKIAFHLLGGKALYSRRNI
jgi:hypothetical protein